jgi:hypothetical protein
MKVKTQSAKLKAGCAARGSHKRKSKGKWQRVKVKSRRSAASSAALVFNSAALTLGDGKAADLHTKSALTTTNWIPACAGVTTQGAAPFRPCRHSRASGNPPCSPGSAPGGAEKRAAPPRRMPVGPA